MEERRKRGSEYSRKRGIKERREFSRGEKWKRGGRGERIQQRGEMGLYNHSHISNFSLCIMRLGMEERMERGRKYSGNEDGTQETNVGST
jgi:hypothetical protein